MRIIINGVHQDLQDLEHHVSSHRTTKRIVGASSISGGAGIGLAIGGPVGAVGGVAIGAITGMVINKKVETKRRKTAYRNGERAFAQHRYVEAYNLFNEAVRFPIRTHKRGLRERAASKAIECIKIIGKACEENGAFIDAIKVYRGAMTRGYKQLTDNLSRKLYINAARWMLFADNHLPPHERNKSLQTLARLDMEEVSGYHGIFDKIIIGLESRVEDRISAAIQPRRHHDVTTTRETLQALQTNDLISPILEMGKLGTLGLHRLSGLSRFPDTTDSITPNSWKTRKILQIEVDPSYDNLHRLAGSETAVGQYSPSSVKIFTAMVRQRPDEARGTAVHEFAHYVMHEVFQNENCDPYLSNNDKERFSGIATRLKEIHDRAGLLPEKIREVFTCYKPDQYHCELIVRIPQLLARGVSEADLQGGVRELLEYYKDVVRPKISAHVEGVRQCALDLVLGDWPKEVITHPNHAFT